MKSSYVKTVLTATLMLMATGAMASGEKMPHQPPHDMEAMSTACEGHQAGDKVSLTDPHGETVSAVCVSRPAVLVAVPEEVLKKMEAAKAACAGKSKGDIVSLAGRNGEAITATCQLRQGELVAFPDRRGGQGR